MSIKDQAESLRKNLRLDSHHAIERFGLFFGVICLTFLVIFGGATTSSLANQREDLDTTTLYTPSFSTSKTQVSGTVKGVYVDLDRKRAMVLMQFADTTSMSANATKYQAFLTGATKTLGNQSLKTNITGHIAVFGSTGYMAMVLDSDQPFQQQILNLTLRANSELVYKPSDTRQVRADLAGQKSFSEYDQWRLYFNPGATGTKKTTALDGSTFDAKSIYDQLVIAPEEKAARKVLDDSLAQMQVDQTRIAEYTADAARVNVDGVRLVLPPESPQIAGDVITGKAGVDGTKSTLTLKPKWVSPRGYDFDWRDGSVDKGYLDQIVPAGQSYVTFLAAKAQATQDDQSSDIQTSNDDWKLSNGTLLSDYASDDTAMQPLSDIHNNLAQAYQDYYTHKVAYQTTAYQSLVDLEIDLKGVESTATDNHSSKVLFKY